MDYQVILNNAGDEVSIVRAVDKMCIPIDSANTDYQKYLNWVEMGNAPERVSPVIQTPQNVTRFQAKAALANAGLLDKVEVMMTDVNTPILYRLAWAEAQTFERQSATVKAMSAALGLNDAELDQLFTAAAAITG